MTPEQFSDLRDAVGRLRDAWARHAGSKGYQPLPGSPAERDLKAFAQVESMHTAHAQAWMLVEWTADQLTAFLKTVTNPVETIAPYTCVRSLLEASALTCWIIEPHLAAHSRVARSLALRYEGVEQQMKWARSIGEDPSKAAKRLNDIANSATAMGFAPVNNRKGERMGAGIKWPGVTEIVRDALGKEGLYRLLSAVAHGHHWATQRLGFALDASQDATSAITGHRLRGMTKEPNVMGMGMLAFESALALARVAWYQSLYLGWDCHSMEALLETGFDELGANEAVRFWRAST